MLSGKERLSGMRPVRMQLDIPLGGPYTRVLRRAAPEVAALGDGRSSLILRGAGIRQPTPLVAARINGFYSRGADRQGVVPKDFSDPDRAAQILADMASQDQPVTRYLAVPVGHIRLPNEAWISHLAAQLTPWAAHRVEAWRSHLKKNAWLSVLRVYTFDPVVLPSDGLRGFQARVPPLRLQNLQPVLDDDGFAAALEQVHRLLEDYMADRSYAAAPIQPDPRAMPAVDHAPQPVYQIQDFSRETGYAAAQLAHWEDRIRRKGQVIFYGPPGTGKTYLAERLAQRLVSGSHGYTQLIQFHAAYAYEDFVQGIRPRTVGGTVVYELQAGRFLEFCRRAECLGPDHPCVLVLDEINRAPLARVFGELMYLLEYRERAIALAAGGPPFKIPQNVYLIGTMNTADRSLALVDQALRRRFAFIRLQPDYGVLAAYLQAQGLAPEALVEVLTEINQSIGDPNYMVGIAFFMGLRAERLALELPQIWQGEIEPYLEEIFFDQPEQAAAWQWDQGLGLRLAGLMACHAAD